MYALRIGKERLGKSSLFSNFFTSSALRFQDNATVGHEREYYLASMLAHEKWAEMGLIFSLRQIFIEMY